MKGCILVVNPEGPGWSSTLLVYQFFDSDQGVEIFFDKEGTVEKGDVDFETAD